tara:strand:+ start:294 stop:443 length:150 start_codon:yes stop_codon:yes gene_type:complete
MVKKYHLRNIIDIINIMDIMDVIKIIIDELYSRKLKMYKESLFKNYLPL